MLFFFLLALVIFVFVERYNTHLFFFQYVCSITKLPCHSEIHFILLPKGILSVHWLPVLILMIFFFWSGCTVITLGFSSLGLCFWLFTFHSHLSLFLDFLEYNHKLLLKTKHQGNKFLESLHV